MKLSVVIPSFRVKAHILGVLEKIGPEVSEIIVVDDGSTDDTKEVCVSYPGIKYIYQSNQGQTGARNTGWQASQGEYLLFFDSDDYLLPNAVEAGISSQRQSQLLDEQ